jgi:hypothetical protein
MNSSEAFTAQTFAGRDIAVVAQRRDCLPRRTGLARGLLGWVALCISLGLSSAISDVITVVLGARQRYPHHD